MNSSPSPNILLNRLYRSPMLLDLHEQQEYWHFFIFETNGVASLITHEGTIPQLRLRIRDGVRIQKGRYTLNGTNITIEITPDIRFQGEVVDLHTLRLTVDNNDDFDADAYYELVNEDAM